MYSHTLSLKDTLPISPFSKKAARWGDLFLCSVRKGLRRCSDIALSLIQPRLQLLVGQGEIAHRGDLMLGQGRADRHVDVEVFFQQAAVAAQMALDRKSTRLNSSH